jgi:hypothetical protein
MSVQLATIVDWEALLDTAIASLVAGVVVTITASATIYGAAMSAEMRRAGRGGLAFAAGALGVVGLVAFTATVVLGLVVMING